MDRSGATFVKILKPERKTNRMKKDFESIDQIGSEQRNISDGIFLAESLLVTLQFKRIGCRIIEIGE